MILDFVNRIKEQQELEASARKGGLLVVFGRRRVGKTRLLAHWLRSRGGMYSQAIEGPLDMQIQQVFADIRPQLSTQIVPKSWPEFLEVLTMQKKPWSLCIDEFPYLTAVDPSLPSQLQKWLDHSMPRGCQLILAGSSTRMMNDLFLNRSAPLYGRAQKLLHVQPMDYAAFCDACALKPADMASFEKFSLVGGIPKYWEFVEKGHDVVALAEALYFDFAPYMEQEPQRILRDEGVTGASALSVLEAVGRGAERPSEIATRLGVVQTNLSRLLQQLLDASVLARELPFGESMRTTKISGQLQTSDWGLSKPASEKSLQKLSDLLKIRKNAMPISAEPNALFLGPITHRRYQHTEKWTALSPQWWLYLYFPRYITTLHLKVANDTLNQDRFPRK